MSDGVLIELYLRPEISLANYFPHRKGLLADNTIQVQHCTVL